MGNHIDISIIMIRTTKINQTYFLPALYFFFIIGIVVAVHTRLNQYAFDDAYIHFRIARNLLDIGAPYYNLGEAIKVSTSSGWTIFITILLAIIRLFRLESHFPFIVSLTNAWITIFGGMVFAKIVNLLLQKPLQLPMWLMLQVCYIAILLPSSIGLMETPLAILIGSIGIYYILLSKPFGFAILGIAMYFRPELIVLLGLILILTCIQKSFNFRTAIFSTLCGILPFMILDLYFFRTIIPHSIIAKSDVYTLPWYLPFIFIIFKSLPLNPLSSNYVSSVILGTLFIASIYFH
jgi:hypothetical protein